MDTTKVQIEIIEHHGYNITFWLAGNGATLRFRIHYENRTPRKNSVYSLYKASDIYFEGMGKEHCGTSYHVEQVTDLCIFAERKKDWLLNLAFNEEKTGLLNEIEK